MIYVKLCIHGTATIGTFFLKKKKSITFNIINKQQY